MNNKVSDNEQTTIHHPACASRWKGDDGCNCLPRAKDVLCDVNHPKHYTVGGYEALDVIRAKLSPEEYRGYLKGNILKYIMRANYKGSHNNDCLKADFYTGELKLSLDKDDNKCD